MPHLPLIFSKLILMATTMVIANTLNWQNVTLWELLLYQTYSLMKNRLLIIHSSVFVLQCHSIKSILHCTSITRPASAQCHHKETHKQSDPLNKRWNTKCRLSVSTVIPTVSNPTVSNPTLIFYTPICVLNTTHYSGK